MQEKQEINVIERIKFSCVFMLAVLLFFSIVYILVKKIQTTILNLQQPTNIPQPNVEADIEKGQKKSQAVKVDAKLKQKRKANERSSRNRRQNMFVKQKNEIDIDLIKISMNNRRRQLKRIQKLQKLKGQPAI